MDDIFICIRFAYMYVTMSFAVTYPIPKVHLFLFSTGYITDLYSSARYHQKEYILVVKPTATFPFIENKLPSRGCFGKKRHQILLLLYKFMSLDVTSRLSPHHLEKAMSSTGTYSPTSHSSNRAKQIQTPFNALIPRALPG